MAEGLCHSTGLYHYPDHILPPPGDLKSDEVVTDRVLLLMAEGYYRVPSWEHTYDYVVYRARSNGPIQDVLPLDDRLPDDASNRYREQLEKRERLLSFGRVCKVLDGSEGTSLQSAVLEWQAAACLRTNTVFKEQCFLFAVWLIAFARQMGYHHLDVPIDMFETYAEYCIKAERCSLFATSMGSAAMRWRQDAHRMVLWSKVLDEVDTVRKSWLGSLGTESDALCSFHRRDCIVWASYSRCVD